MAVISNGTTLIDNGALDSAVPTGKLTLISTQTASNSSTISFTSGINSTYDVYVFKFIHIHPSYSSHDDFLFNLSTDSGSNYNVNKTGTYWSAINFENNSYADIEYNSSLDHSSDTGFNHLTDNTGNDNDQSLSGFFTLYEPSNTSRVTHYSTRIENSEIASSIDTFVSGYANTTSAINGIQFKFQSGNIASGLIKMYGVS
tara:strand:- start:573 stop:1175 length:603 start_codon:yes stop_codon:yes gene_type:complete